jgi:hypothetical protein
VSSGLIYAATPPSQPPPAPIWVGTDVTWTGWDGTQWRLTTPETGVCLLRDGVEGLHFARFTSYTRRSPAVHGQTFAGGITEPRTVAFNILLWHDGTSGDWVERDRAFWHSMHPAQEGTLMISPAGAGSRRTLQARFVPEDYAFPIDPSMAGWNVYPVQLIADQPFWRGRPFRAGWRSESPGEDFYEQEGPQLINIYTGHTTNGAVVRNDGDEAGWPVWTVVGPSEAAHVGVGTSVVDIPFEIVEGKALVVDTDPRVRTAIEYDYTAPGTYANPVDRTEDLTGDVNFAPIPPGGIQPINISLTGTGLIRFELTPLYWRAW